MANKEFKFFIVKYFSVSLILRVLFEEATPINLVQQLDF